MEPVQYLKDMLSITEGGIFDNTIDIVLGTAPTISNVYQSYKIFKLDKRMKINEQQLLVIKDKIETSENEVFYKAEVFPLIVKKLMEDDEDEKAKIIIDGFEHLIDEDLKEIEIVYHYYDVLSELRYSDIILFVERYMPYEMKRKVSPDIKINVEFPTDEEKRSGEYKEKQLINSYQTNKLERLGLIQMTAYTTIEDGEDDITKQDTPITNFGKQFLTFFALEELYKE